MTHPQSSEAPELAAHPFEVGSHKLIYAFSRPDAPKLQGMLKVGDASIPASSTGVYSQDELREAAQRRIHEYTGTAQVDTELEHTEIALRRDSSGALVGFRDYDVHRVILNSGYDRYTDPNPQLNGREWFENIKAEDVAAAVEAVKEDQDFISVGASSSGISLYPHQQAAVDQTQALFQDGSIDDPKRMLWNAKMRFGKTIAAYSYILEAADVKRVLVVTHRPDVNSSWFEDFQKFGLNSEGWRYGSKRNGNSFDELVAVDSFGQVTSRSDGLIWFASMQDLRLSGLDTEELKKNRQLFAMDWDLVITDEAHEGTLTELANSVYGRLKTKYSLDLSGTPYNLIEAGDWDISGSHRYRYDDVYSWSYVDEQKAKRGWAENHSFDEPNPYEIFPEVEFRTYDVSAVLDDVEPGAFPTLGLNELFRVDPATGKFVEESSVVAMLKKLSGDGLYNTIKPESFPFHDSFGWMFRHTLWCLPSVAAVGAMEELLSRASSGFAGWTVVNATGLGNEEADGTRALARVRTAVSGSAPSITLSFRMLTTGISVPEWTAVFMMSNTSNAMSYMQTAFRATTPWILPNGSRKTKAYIFDFNVDRCLSAIVEAAKSSSRENPSKDPLEQDELDRRAIGDFLQYASVLSMRGAHFEAPDSNQIIDRINEAYLNDVVERGFDSPKLFSRSELSNYDISMAELLNRLRDIQGGAAPKSGKISISDLTEEERQKLNEKVKEIQAKALEDSRDSLSDEDKATLKESKKKLSDDEQKTRTNRKNAISILTGIACRLPMLVLAADTDEITPQNFNTLIDEESWREFMPSNLIRIKPESVAALDERRDETLGEDGGDIYWEDIARFFDQSIFSGACERVRLMAKVADSKSPLERAFRMASMFSMFKNPDKETVLTPWRVVNLQYGSTVGGLVTVDLEKSTTKDVYSYLQNLETGELVSALAPQALKLIDEGTHRPSAVWIDPGKLSPKLQDELAALDSAEDTGQEALAAALSADTGEMASSVALAERGAKIADESSSRSAFELWAKDDLSVYDINSKTSLYPLYAALSRFYIERLRIEGKPFPGHGAPFEPGELSLASEQEIWREVIEKNIFLNCRVDYSKSIAQRVLMGFDRSQQVNATSIDVLELKAALEWWNTGGDVEPPKKSARKSSYMPDWWIEIEDVYSAIGATLRLANPGFVRYHSSIGVRARLANHGYNQQSFQKILDKILLSKQREEEQSMGKKSDERSAERLQAVRELLDIAGQTQDLPRFDLSAGNPPYQITEEGADSKRGGKQGKIYPLFWLTSLEMSKVSVMVFPDGWRFASGKGSIYEAPRMRESVHLVDVYPLGRTAFDASISVDVVHSDSGFTNDGSITRHFMQVPKIWQRLSGTYSSTESVFNGQRNNGLSGEGEFVERKKGHPAHIHESEVPDSLKVYHGRSMRVFWVDKDHPNFKPTSKVKLIVPSTGASRSFRDSHVIPAYEEYSDYWFSAFFDTEDQAKNFRLYLGTKLYRHLHEKGAVSQNATKSTHKFVPNIGDYSSNSAVFNGLPEDENEAIQEIDERIKILFSITEEESAEIYDEQNES